MNFPLDSSTQTNTALLTTGTSYTGPKIGMMSKAMKATQIKSNQQPYL